MTEQEAANAAFIRRFTDVVFRQKDIAEHDGLVADRFTERDVATGGLEGARKEVAKHLAAYSDFQVIDGPLVADGDWVVEWAHQEGRITGTLWLQPPTGRHHRVRGLKAYRIVDGQIAEMIAHFDELATLAAIDAPTPPTRDPLHF
jgi:predicted ester cyclase